MNPDMPLFEQSPVQSKMLFISAVMPIMSIYRLPLGHYEYAGHVINLPQDVVSFAQYLSAELDASLAPWRLRHPSIWYSDLCLQSGQANSGCTKEVVC